MFKSYFDFIDCFNHPPELAVVMQAALDSIATCITTARLRVIRSVNKIKIRLKHLWSVIISAAFTEGNNIILFSNFGIGFLIGFEWMYCEIFLLESSMSLLFISLANLDPMKW